MSPCGKRWFDSCSPGALPASGTWARSPKGPLPGAVLNRRKTGFSIPVRDWLIAAAPEAPESGMRGLRGWSQLLARLFKMAGLKTSPDLALAC